MSRREPGLTYEGALRILGRRDVEWLDHLGDLLGGAVLPTDSLDTLPGMLPDLAGPDRWRLVVAAHSTIVVTAYFEAVRELLDQRRHSPVGLSEQENEEKGRIVSKTTQVLYLTPIPAPSPEAAVPGSSVYTENKAQVAVWLTALDEAVKAFTVGLAVEQPPDWPRSLPDQAIKRYEAHFLRLAAVVPEFQAWSGLDELELELDENDTLGSESAALEAPDAAVPLQETTPLSIWLNEEPRLIPPALDQVFIEPRYRFAVTGVWTRPADEVWWTNQPIEEDIDQRLMELIKAVDAARLPILVLGHPGAGKSTLMRVLAARLPQAEYTVVQVPLRHARADASIPTQIQEALDAETEGIQWSELAERSQTKTRLVILDGLDEIPFQTQPGLTGYLRAVQEFQRVQLERRQPVAVIVTSRTVVADRVQVPHGTPVVMLEKFSDYQITQWVTAWEDANAEDIAAGRVGDLGPGTALTHRSLTAQPLMLTMMAAYAAEGHLELETLTTDFYERLLRQFAARETAKTTPELPEQDVAMLAERELRCLSIAALGMFTRGRQYISDQELAADLAAWRVFQENPLEAGRQLVTKFFSLHRSAQGQQHYAFLHAAFGDYLVARLITEELRYAAESRLSEVDAGGLFPLFAHRILSTRRPILEFVKDAMVAQLAADERRDVVEVITDLLGRHRYRPKLFVPRSYQPISTDDVEQLAAYSANLILVRLIADPEPLAMSEVFDSPRMPKRAWQSLLGLWQAGLDDEDRDSLLHTIRHEDGHLFLSDSDHD